MVRKYLCGVSCVALLFAADAMAQPAPRASADTMDTAQGSGLEEIVVTARRREEKLQTVPISVSAVSGDVLKTHEIANAIDLGKLIPALGNTETSRDLEGYQIRGLSGGSGSATGQSTPIQPYFAEVPYPAGDGGGSGRFYDLENIQVLKGPQGTLFGRNSAGGAIVMQPKKPGNDFSGYVTTQFGNHNDFEQEAAINIPVIQDKLLVRVAGNHAERDGFTKDILNGKDLDSRDYWAGRVSVVMRPTDEFENDVVADSLYIHNNGSSEVIGYLNPGLVFGAISLGPLGKIPLTLGNGPLVSGLSNPATQVATALAGFKAGAFALFPLQSLAQTLAQQQALGPRQVATGANPILKIISQGFADTARWDLTDNIALRNIFGYREYKRLTRDDDDGTVLPLIQGVTPRGWNSNISQYTEELQLQGKSLNDSLAWVVGAFGLYSHAAGLNHAVTISFGNPTYGQNSPTARSEAVYAQATYDLGHSFDALDGLKFTGGYRFTWDYRQLNSVSRNATGGCTILGADQNCDLSLEVKGSAPSWTVGLDYRLTPGTLVYVTSRRGFRAGGLNNQSVIASQIAYKPETVTDEEIGVKSDWELYGVKARTNLAAFHMDYGNKQASQAFSTVLSNGQPITTQIIVNAGDATIEGVETDFTVIPVADLELTASWAYTKASFDRYVIVSTGQSVPGQTYPYVPQNKLSLGARYTLPVSGDYGAVSVGALLAYQSHQYLGVSPSDPAATNIGQSFTTLDLYLDWKNVLSSPVDLSLFATNVTDQVARVGGYPIYGIGGFTSFFYNEPQMYGAKIKYRFGG